MTRNRIVLAVLVVALVCVVLASRGRPGHIWLPVLILLLGIIVILVAEVRSGLDAVRREARRK